MRAPLADTMYTIKITFIIFYLAILILNNLITKTCHCVRFASLKFACLPRAFVGYTTAPSLFIMYDSMNMTLTRAQCFITLPVDFRVIYRELLLHSDLCTRFELSNFSVLDL